MQIDKILAGIRESQKTASEKPAEAPATEKVASAAPTTALDQAMKAAVAATEKTASEKQVAGPVDDVMKIAADVAAAEKEAMIKEAQMLGAAWADAAIARIQAWQEASTKVASVAPVAPVAPADPEFSKFAAENPEVIKQAQEYGYEVTRQGIEKMAEDAYVQGYNDTVQAIHKTATLEFLKAASLVSQIIDAQASR